jgi:signal transduction histidine kinase
VYFALEPLYSLAIRAPVDWVRLASFLLTGSVVSWLSEALHRARRQASEDARRTRDALAQLETERVRLHAVLESIPAGVVVAEAPSGRIVLGNSQADEILGHPLIPTAGVGDYRQWFGYYPDGRRLEPEDYPLVRGIRGEALRDQEYLYQQEGEAPRWLRSSSTPIRSADGTVEGAVVLFSNITQERQVQELLLHQTRALQEADRHKNEFLAMLAHELRNPLAPIRNALQVLALRGEEPATVARLRGLMERQVQQIVRLVDDLLEISRISRGKVTLQTQPLDLAVVVGAAVETSRPLIEERRHELTVSPPAEPIRVEADPARLAQVLSNLLNNSAKYTEVGGRIWLTTCRENGHAVLRVRDNGAGIAPEMLPRIFDLFTQADATLDRAQGGLGIGLTLVRRLVEMHGGTVEAHSGGLGQGSEFVVRLPEVGW